jgi:hypothetical protein
MDVSYDCELNLSTNFEPTSFEEVASNDYWKEAKQKEYDLSSRMGHESWWTLHSKPNQFDASESSRTSTN